MKNSTKSIMLMVGASFTQSTGSLISVMIHKKISILYCTLFYYFIPLLVLVPLVFKNKIMLKYQGFYVFRAFCSVVAVSSFFYTSSILDLSEANLLFTTSPLFVAIMARFFLKENITLIGYASIFVAFIGVYAIIQPHFHTYIYGALMGLFSGFSMALSQLTLKSLTKKGESTNHILFYQYLYASIFAGLLVVIDSIYFSKLQMKKTFDLGEFLIVMLLLLIIGFISIAGQKMMAIAFKYMDAYKLVPLLYLSIPIAAFFGYFLYNQKITLTVIIGTMLVCSGVWSNIYFKKVSNNA